jgi:hypothetical protein
MDSIVESPGYGGLKAAGIFQNSVSHYSLIPREKRAFPHGR